MGLGTVTPDRLDSLRVLVCGGRDYYGDVECLKQIPGVVDIVIHGGAKGADSRAGAWFESRGIHTAVVKALWDFYDKPAGRKRNVAMLLLRPDYCVAFPGGRGTADMVRRFKALDAGPVWRPYGV